MVVEDTDVVVTTMYLDIISLQLVGHGHLLKKTDLQLNTTRKVSTVHY